jgi:peptidoglycan/LPS O-acetylase OafA/YrhL
MNDAKVGSSLQLNPQFPVLDTLRAVGALAVLTTHTAFQAGDYARHGIWGTLLSRLDVGVAIFFVLSGFLLSRPHLARVTAGLDRPATGRYYWKRFLRVYPVYAVTVVIALSLIPANDDLGPRQWLRTLLLADTYTADRLPQGLTQMWSLAVECAFYVVLPLLMLVALGRRGALRLSRLVALLVGLVALSVWWHLALASWISQYTSGVPMTWLPGFLSWFAVGIALAWAHVQHQSGPQPARYVRVLSSLGAMPGVCWSAVAGLMLVAATPLAGPTLLFVASPAESLTKHCLYALVGGLIVVTGIFPDPESLYARTLSLMPLRHLGHISYSTFCLHLPVLHLVMGVTGYQLFDGHGFQIWVATLVVSLVASEVLYRLVEKPGMRLKDLGRRPPPAGHASTAAQATTTR